MAHTGKINLSGKAPWVCFSGITEGQDFPYLVFAAHDLKSLSPHKQTAALKNVQCYKARLCYC